MNHAITIGDVLCLSGAIIGLLLVALGAWLFVSGSGPSDGADVVRASGAVGILFGTALAAFCIKWLI